VDWLALCPAPHEISSRATGGRVGAGRFWREACAGSDASAPARPGPAGRQQRVGI